MTRLRKHGLSYSPIYRIWQLMRQRCYLKTNKSYKNYGGRGIKVCLRWQDFQNFYADMGKNYRVGMSIERIDNNGDYEPNNCKWIPVASQGRNKRTTRLVTYKGKTQTVTDWEKELGYKPDYISSKMRQGFGFKDIIKLKKYERYSKRLPKAA